MTGRRRCAGKKGLEEVGEGGTSGAGVAEDLQLIRLGAAGSDSPPHIPLQRALCRMRATSSCCWLCAMAVRRQEHTSRCFSHTVHLGLGMVLQLSLQSS